MAHCFRTRRWRIMWVAVSLLVVVSGGACTKPSGLTELSGWAPVLRFDGIRLGAGGSDAYPRISCAYVGETSPPVLITRRDRWCCGPDVAGDWMVPESGGALASLRLEFLRGEEPPAQVEFSVGEAVYRSDSTTDITMKAPTFKLADDTLIWAGSVRFEGLPLVRGQPYEERWSVGRLVVTWECAAP